MRGRRGKEGGVRGNYEGGGVMRGRQAGGNGVGSAGKSENEAGWEREG